MLKKLSQAADKLMSLLSLLIIYFSFVSSSKFSLLGSFYFSNVLISSMNEL
jgi:hypothetical protein